MHRLVVLFDAAPGVTGRVEQACAEPVAASAVVSAVREAEAQGRAVTGVMDRRREPVVVAADLIVRLRRVAEGLSEEELAVLLDLLPL